jgi:hypothetical protein
MTAAPLASAVRVHGSSASPTWLIVVCYLFSTLREK